MLGGQQQLSRTGSGSVQPNLPAQSSGAPKVTAKPQQPHPAPAPVPECATQSNDTSAAPQAHPPHSPERLRQPDESPSLGGVSDRVATGLHESPAAFAPQPTSGSRPPPSSQYPDDACASDESDDEAVPSSELHVCLPSCAPCSRLHACHLPWPPDPARAGLALACCSALLS